MPGSYPDSESADGGANHSPLCGNHVDVRTSTEFWNPTLQYLRPIGTSSNGTTTSPPITPVNLLTLDGDLPPTPPSISRKQASNHDNGRAVNNIQMMPTDHLKSRAGGSKASIHQSPPTPDKTPPALLQTPFRQTLSRTSTRAESFRTAREEPTTPREDEGLSGTQNANKGLSRYTTFSHSRAPSQEKVPVMHDQTKGLEAVRDNSDGPRLPKMSKGVSFHQVSSGTINGDWDQDLMRNVTVRRKRLPRPKQDAPSNGVDSQHLLQDAPKPERFSPPANHPPRQASISIDQETSSKQKTISSETQGQLRNRHSKPVPQHSHFSEPNGSPEFSQPFSGALPFVPKQRLNTLAPVINGHRSVSDNVRGQAYESSPARAAHMRKISEPNRHSTGSNLSGPIVEAVIVSSPPRKPRTLRHVSKNMSLRSPSGSVASSSPVLTSSPVDSDRTLRPAVVSGQGSKGSDPGHRRTSSGSSNLSHNSQPHSLRHRSDRTSLREEAFRSPLRVSSGPEDLLTHAPTHTPRMGVDASAIPTDRVVRETNGTGERRSSILRRSEVHAKHPLIVTTSPKVTFKTASPDIDDENTLERKVSRTSRTQSIQSEHASFEISPDLTNGPSTMRRNSQKRVVSAPVQQGSTEIDGQRGSISSLRRPSATEPPVSAGAEFFSRFSMDRASTVRDEDFSARRSFDRSSVATYEYGRPSLDRLTIRTEDNSLARYMTPFSQLSDLGEGLELSEATAVSIYPHTNNSLLVVQQGARSIQATGPITLVPGGSAAHTEVPLLTLKPSTPPPIINEPVNVDSPLKNPRRPPEPPAIRFIPATPADELNCPIEDSLGTGEPRSLARRPTLTDKARRYSESVLQPLLARTNSMRRSVVGPSKQQTRHVSDGAGQPVRSKNNNLHPFWQPKRFWDEDSDEELDQIDRRTSSNNAADYDHDDEDPFEERLPAGGDTTELGEPRGIARIYNSIRNKRNSGAFLLGNTLGLERAGTNRRKPQINLPTNLARTTSGRVVRRVESVGTLRSGFSSVTSASARSQGKGAKGGSAVPGSAGNKALRRKASRRKIWKGLGLHVEWIGVAGLQEMMRERKREKRREDIRKSIGTRFMVEGAPVSNN